MAFKIEDIVGMRVPFVNPLDGSLQLRDVQEVMYQGNIVWPLAQAYTYVIESVTAYDAGGHLQPTPMLLASGLLKLHYLGTVRKMLGSTVVETLTNQPLTPLSHAPVQGVNFIADQLEYYNESRGEMVGSEIDTSVLLTFRGSLGFEASLKVQANELLARIVDMSAASATPSSLSDISKDGTIMQVAYVSRCAVTRTYTAGTYGGEVEDAPLNLCVDIEGGQPVIQQVQGGTGFVYVTIPQNLYPQRRKISVYMQDAISGEKSAIAEVYQEGTASVGRVLVHPSIDSETGQMGVLLSFFTGTEPTGPITISGGTMHVTPTGGTEKTYPLGIGTIQVNLEETNYGGFIPLPEVTETGRCQISGLLIEKYSVILYSVENYTLIGSQDVVAYEIVASSIVARGGSILRPNQFSADGTRRIHFTADVNVYVNGTLFETRTSQDLTPLPTTSPSGVQFYVDGNEIYNESRGKVVGPQEDVEISLNYKGLAFASKTMQLEANTLSTTWDLSECVFEVQDGSVIPAEGGNITFHYVARRGIIETYTSGRYIYPIEDAAMRFDPSNSRSFYNVQGGEGTLVVDIYSNHWIVPSIGSTQIRDNERYRGVLQNTHTQAAYISDSHVSIYPTIANPWNVYVNMDLLSGSVPPGSSYVRTDGESLEGYFYIHFLPDGGTERKIRLDALSHRLQVGTPQLFSVTPPSQAETGECWIELTDVEYVHVDSLPHVRYSYTP